jgi:Fe-S oxidoreductase
MTKLKAEFLYQYYKSNSIPLRTRIIAYFSTMQAIASKFAVIYNTVIHSNILSGLIKKIIGFAAKRSLPKVYRQTFRKWLKKHLESYNNTLTGSAHSIYLFIDEFTNFNDVPIGQTTVKLLNKLGYRILVLNNKDSGRPMLSKGFLGKARQLAKHNVELYYPQVSENIPLIGIEPSAIFAFRDEYPDLLRGELQSLAKELAKNVFTTDEFLAREIDKGRIQKEQFTSDKKLILLHGHCQQKSIASTAPTKTILGFPQNYTVEEIKSGCCGMAGSFGYEKEHFELSNKIGELVLFPAVRKAAGSTIIAAPGTSCRHQIKDGTGKIAKHPVEVLYEALN